MRSTPGAFQPAVIAAMNEAFDAACKELQDSGQLAVSDFVHLRLGRAA